VIILAGTTLVTRIDSTQTTGIALSDSTGFPASGACFNWN